MIVVAGEVLVDLVVRPDGGVDPRLGGGPYNAARSLARLGAPTTFFGGLADDRFGRLLRGALDAEGVAIGMPGPSAAPTTLALVDLDQAGVASYGFYLAGTAAADVAYPAARRGLRRDPGRSPRHAVGSGGRRRLGRRRRDWGRAVGPGADAVGAGRRSRSTSAPSAW